MCYIIPSRHSDFSTHLYSLDSSNLDCSDQMQPTITSTINDALNFFLLIGDLGNYNHTYQSGLSTTINEVTCSVMWQDFGLCNYHGRRPRLPFPHDFKACKHQRHYVCSTAVRRPYTTSRKCAMPNARRLYNSHTHLNFARDQSTQSHLFRIRIPDTH